MTDEDKMIKRLQFFLKDDQWAIQLCLDLVYIAHLWDDLIDKDKDRSGSDINMAFAVALINIPANPFYKVHAATLHPILLNTILKWQDANTLEVGSEHDMRLAFVHRAGIVEIFNICAYLIGGMPWAVEHGPDIRRMYQESWDEFSEEMIVKKGGL